MSVDLTGPLDRLAEQLAGIDLARAGAEAGAEAMREATASYLGGDLSMSGLRASDAVFDTAATAPGRVSIVGAGPTFALADKGRRRSVRAQADRRSALVTPWGPRASVEGSLWGGFGITDNHASEALAAAAAAVVDGIEWGGLSDGHT